jgi:DNA repair protein RadD
MQPRWYQTEAVEAIAAHFATSNTNPAIILPTGAGKSLVIAMLAQRMVANGGRVAVFQHRAELIRQNAEKFQAICPDVPVGIWSASLNQKSGSQPVVFAGIQSAAKEESLLHLGWRDLIIADECHLIPPDGDGQWLSMLRYWQRLNPDFRFAGLTASPWRLDSGSIIGPDRILQSVAFSAPITRLIEEGYLCNLISKDPDNHIDTSGVKMAGGEYILKQLDDAASKDAAKVDLACRELVARTAGRNSVLVFCCGRKHARMVVEAIANLEPGNVAYVDGITSKSEREDTLEAFASQQFKYLANIDVLTTGFDAPCIDAIAMLRPSQSKGLVYQMIGRGLRTHQSKQDCLVLDFAGNLITHGPIDSFADDYRTTQRGEGGEAPSKVCPECKEIVHAAATQCTQCDHQFPEKEIKHDIRPAEVRVLSGGEDAMETVDVESVSYTVYAPDHKPRMLRVTYKLIGAAAVAEYICLEHTQGSWQQKKAAAWWRDRSDVPVPDSVWAAYRLHKADESAIASPRQLVLKWTKGKRWPDIFQYIGIQKAIMDAGYLADLGDTIYIDRDIFRGLKKGG